MLSLEGYWIKQFDGGMATVRNRDVKKPIIGQLQWSKEGKLEDLRPYVN